MIDTGEHFWEAELHRLKGELLLARSAEQHAEAATCLQQALDIARRQQAKLRELRAAVSLSRLWQQQGKRQEAHDLGKIKHFGVKRSSKNRISEDINQNARLI